MRLNPYVRRYLFPDTGGGGGAAPAAAPAPPSPPDGKATPPAGTPSGTPAAPNAPPNEIDDFTPPDFDDGSGAAPISKPGAKKEPAAPDPKKAEPPKAGEPPKKGEPPKPGEPPKKTEPLPADAPAAKIRERLAQVERERDEWKTKAEAPHPRVKPLEDSVASLTAEREQLSKDVEAMRTELSMHDPIASDKVRKLDSEYDAKFAAATRFMPDLVNHINGLVQEYATIAKGDKAKLGENLKAFRTKVGELVGPENAQAALQVVAEGLDFLDARNVAIKEVRESGTKLHFDGLKASYQKNVDLTKQHLAEALNVPDDFETAQPYHPLVFLKRAMDALDEPGKEGVKTYEAKVDEYMRFAANGLSPESQAAMQNLSPAERKARMDKVEGQRIEAAAWVRKNAKQAAFMHRFLPAILEDYARLLEEAKKRGEGAPPDPNAGGGGDPTGNDVNDLTKFQTPSLDAIA